MLIGMFAETFIHPGSGQSASAIDLPVAREATTSFPFMAGSSLKGAFRDSAEQQSLDEARLNTIFGQADEAGQILVSDARLLLLPVRSLNSVYKWVTCPLILERLKRDMSRSGMTATFDLPNLFEGQALYTGQGTLFLEERSFTKPQNPPDLSAVVTAIKPFIKYEDSQARVAEQLVVLSNDDFTWFAKFGLPIMARNVLKSETKTSENLWYEETLPPDTLMYSMLAERRKLGQNGSSLTDLTSLYDSYPYLQAGGNETVGQGWFVLSFVRGQA